MIVFLASTLPPPKSATAPKPMAPELSTTIASSEQEAVAGSNHLTGHAFDSKRDLKRERGRRGNLDSSHLQKPTIILHQGASSVSSLVT
ncbi:hypothetical protein VIGAN_02175200 [Vigna angularis var. angularis]|uniref:Uncharacterized protein n=1 Tax=Vigna angularis var. angularis TaxID=157739 RepID=A0A0S3REA7_PHAAN|nr:hypothetical protein VIGAN_02175200 [Vigna angularis var. angularis]